MMRKRQFLINALMSVVQVVVTGVVFFVLYRFVKDTIGIEYLGVWSLVLATTSASSIADLGLANSTVKYVSMYLARERTDRVAQIVQTATVSLGVVLGVVLVALYPLLETIIAFFVEPAYLQDALEILPYALVSFWLNSTAGAVQGCIDGYQRIDLRSIVYSASVLVYLIAALILVPKNGLVGLAQAQVLQAGLLLIASWLLLRHLLPALPFLPHRWRRDVFREMLAYSLQFQVISFSKLLFEPLTKSLVMRFGGAATSGYFEFAYRMVVQLRALIVTAHQSIVPTIADLQERQPELIQDIYRTSSRLILYLILAALPFGLAVTPLISRVWIGSYEATFVLFANLIFVGWFLNMIGNPAYFAYLGIGKLRWNVASHLVIGLLNGGLGVVLGWLYRGTGVVVGFVVALVIGSLMIAVAYQREYGIPVRDLVQRETILLGLAGFGAMTLALFLYDQVAASWSLVGQIALVVGSYLVVVAGPLWLHPARQQLQHWLTGLLLRRSSEATLPESE
ncbi:MAG: lipopolysaccharide biosynthesis protein [Rhodothermales bacterium]